MFSRSGKQPWSFHKTREVLTEVGSTNTDADILLYSCRTSDRPGKTKAFGHFHCWDQEMRLSPERSLTGVWNCFLRNRKRRVGSRQNHIWFSWCLPTSTDVRPRERAQTRATRNPDHEGPQEASTQEGCLRAAPPRRAYALSQAPSGPDSALLSFIFLLLWRAPTTLPLDPELISGQAGNEALWSVLQAGSSGSRSGW